MIETNPGSVVGASGEPVVIDYFSEAMPLRDNHASALDGLVCDRRETVSDGNDEYKIWQFVRRDLPMSFGKFGPQSGHAFGTCMVLTDRRAPEVVDLYIATGQAKIAVAVDDGDELLRMVQLCREAGLVAVAVEDAGRTEFEGRTITTGAVGPCLRSELPGKVRRLRIFKGHRDQPDGELRSA
jgi:PTH2 family peptidyl-tRNA hydrolase